MYTNEVSETVTFYVDVLGFRCLSNDPELEWARVQLDNADIMITKPNAHISFTSPIFSGSFYFTTDAIDLLWENVRHKANICYPIEDFDYGMREFAIYDNNGYMLQFGMELPAPDI